MVVYISGKGKPQGHEPPKQVTPTVRKSTGGQYSLFGNGQSGKHSNQPQPKRDIKAEERRAQEKFSNTNAGKQQGAKKVAVTQEPSPRAAYPNPCHYTHPDYEVAPGFKVKGGSGITPFHKNEDIYIALDQARVPTKRSHPWEQGEDFIFHIKNYGVPDDPMAFRQLVMWIAEQIKAGKRVHIGCMAGHGRTGMVLAALRMHMAGDKDAIKHVRDNYCDQAVETDGQISWLMEHWGVNAAPPRKKREYAQPQTTASKAGAIKHGNFDYVADPLMDMEPEFEKRDVAQNSWAANSPWYKPVEGPPAQLGEAAWYDDPFMKA